MTRLLLTKIPFYKEVVIMSFSCEFCGYRNNEMQSGSEIQTTGVRISLKVTELKDLNRRIVRSDFSSVIIKEVNLEIPVGSQKGEVTTIEGIIERAITGLQQDQGKRRIDHPEDATQIDNYVEKLRELLSVDTPFTFVLTDISGNCYIENFRAPHPDPNMSTGHFNRTKDDDHMLGIFQQDELRDQDGTIEEEDENESDDAKKAAKDSKVLKRLVEGEWTLEELHGEVLQFMTNCPECSAPCETNMKVTSIPHFKDVVIMATVCDVCGAKTNEVKAGSGIEPQGTRFEVKITCRDDFSRDVLKSETCSLHIPEMNCEVGSHALGGRFTTVEGIVVAMRDQLIESGGMFRDSQDVESKKRMDTFIEDLNEVLAGKRCVTLVLDDPTGNSYIQSLSDDGLDERLQIVKYDRTFEQNEDLGLNDMKTENY